MKQDSQPEIEGLIERTINRLNPRGGEVRVSTPAMRLALSEFSALLSLKEGGGLGSSSAETAALLASQASCSATPSSTGKGANYCVRCERPTPRDFCPKCGAPLDPPAEVKP